MTVSAFVFWGAVNASSFSVYSWVILQWHEVHFLLLRITYNFEADTVVSRSELLLKLAFSLTCPHSQTSKLMVKAYYSTLTRMYYFEFGFQESRCQLQHLLEKVLHEKPKFRLRFLFISISARLWE